MNKIFVIAGIMFLLYVSSYQYKTVWTNAAFADTTDINTNKSSELSLLMREMYNHAAEARKAVSEQRTVSYPKTFLNINTAKPTDDKTKNEYYTTFADLYLQTLEGYENSTNANRVKSFNNVVNACLACHSSHCPGPVPKIKRLLIPLD